MYIYKKIRNFFIYLIAFGYIIFEELFWVRIAKPFYNYISKYHLYESFLNYVQYGMNKYVILCIFTLLFIISEILGPVALAYLFRGDVFIGILIYIIKTIPLVVAFAIFERGKTQLFSFNWFKKSYDFIMKLINKLKESKIFRNVKIKIKIFKQLISSEKKNLHVELFNEAKETIKTKIHKEK
jgi:uncharacterized membrane protein